MASGENGIIKSPKTLLIEAEAKIGELENALRNADKANEVLKWQNAQLRVAVTALGRHYDCPPEKAKVIIDAYIAEQEAEYLRATDEAKQKYLQDLRDGKVPDLKIINNTEKD